MSIFKQPGIVRWDLPWYGIGWHRGLFWCNYQRPGHTLFINSYRRSPLCFTWLNRIGWVGGRSNAMPPWLWFSGSIRNPRASWHVRVWRLYVGGNTPKRIERRLMARLLDDEARAVQAEEEMGDANP